MSVLGTEMHDFVKLEVAVALTLLQNREDKDVQNPEFGQGHSTSLCRTKCLSNFFICPNIGTNWYGMQC